MLLFASGMLSNKLKRWIWSPLATGMLLPFIWATQAPVGLAQAKTDAVVTQALSEQEVGQLAQQANQLIQTGDYAAAAQIWERLRDYAESEFEADHPYTAGALNNLALSYGYQELYSKAEALYLRAVEIHEKAFDSNQAGYTSTLNNLAGLYESQGLYKKAEPLFRRALVIDEKALGADHPDTAGSLNNLAGLYKAQGSYNKAEPLYLRTLKIREKVLGSDHPDTAMSLNDLAQLYAYMGLFNQAEPLYQRGLEIYEKSLGADHPFTAASLNNFAGLYYRQGMYSKAEPLYQRALRIVEIKLGPGHTNVSKSLNNLALLYGAQGLYSKAEPLYERALAITEKALGADHPSTATSLNNLALLYDQQSLYSKAEPLHKRALAIRGKALGADHPSTAISLNNLALLYDAQGLYSKAEPLYERALSITEKALGPDHPSTATSFNNLASLYAAQGLYSKAESLYKRALAIKEKALGPDHPDTATSLNNLALLYAQQGLYSKAEPLLLRGISTETRLIQRETPYLPRSDRQTFASSFGSANQITFSSATQGPGGASLALFSRLNRQGLLEEIEKRQAQLAALPGDQQQTALELRALTQQLSSLTLKPEQRQALRVRQEELEKQLYRLLPQLNPRIVEVEQVAIALPADGVLIEFQRFQPFDGKKPKGEQWGKARYLAMVLKPDASITVVDLGEASGIDQAITTAVSATRRGLADAPQQLNAVSQLLIEPLKSATAGSKTWFVSPDGELNRLPFAALPAPKGQGYLTEAVDLRLLTTGRELLDLQQPNPKAQSAALVVADPAYGQISRRAASPAVGTKQQTPSGDGQTRSADLSDQLTWAPLPATAQEGESIKAITGGSLLVQEQATADAIKQTPAPRLLHLATHAFYLPNQAKQQPEPGDGLLGQASISGVVRRTNLQGESPLLRSGIALAGANQPGANPNDDGYLTALEVAQLAWEGTDLVVISACESGLGDLQVGEGVYGLKRAIAVAGARSSLLSLWKVDDVATKVFMESFYGRLKQGQGRAEALANTQKEFRESPDRSEYRRPYYWAAFQLSGDWGPVKGI